MDWDLAHPIGVVSRMNGSKRVFKCPRLRCCVTGLKMVKGAYSSSSELRLSATGYGIRHTSVW